MNGQKDPTLPIITIVLAIFGVLIVQQIPLTPSRPGVSDVTGPESQQNVPARLWQDPLGVVRKYHQNKERQAITDQIARFALEKSTIDKNHNTNQNDGTAKSQEKADTCPKAHAPCTLQQQINDRIDDNGKKRKVVILGVMVQGGPYAEEVEARLRRRYSVLSALDVSGFVPTDATHIGYFEPKSEPESEPEPESNLNEPVPSLPSVVPYEWFKPKENGKHSDSENSPQTDVLVLWIDNDAVMISKDPNQPKPLASLDRLIGHILPNSSDNKKAEDAQPAIAKKTSGNEKTEIIILGPATSGTLQQMINEIYNTETEKAQCKNYKELNKFKFYSPFATADDCQLLGQAANCKLQIQKTFEDCDIQYLRTTRSDYELAKTIADELKLRRIIPGRLNRRGHKSYVVLLAEWDTLYGRRLPESMEEVFKEQLKNWNKKEHMEKSEKEQQPEHSTNFNENPDWLIRLSYLRGVDGQVFNETTPESPATQNGENKNQENSEALERPRGRSQLDYIRRLADRLVLKQEELRQGDKEGHKGRIRAIGILGNDTYDKQLLLQALRPHFPGAVFFTTDLDARLLQRGDFKWTRDLIIASSYRLRLSDDLQQDIPPFRSSYQTALFFSTILALNNHQKTLDQSEIDCLIKPRILEVGRHRAFDLSSESQSTDENPATNESNDCKPINLGLEHNIVTIHPEPSPAIPRILSKLFYPGIFSILLLLIVSDALKDTMSNATVYVQSKPTRFRAMILFFVLSLFLYAIWHVLNIGAAFHETKLGLGEPFSFTEGVSAWPRVIIALIGVGFAVFYLFYAWFTLKKNADTLKEEFQLPDCKTTSSQQEPIESLTALLQKFIQFWNKIVIFHWHKNITHQNQQPIKIEQLWHEYCEKARFGNRLLRTVVPFLLFLFLSVSIFFAFGVSHVPVRGVEIGSLLRWSSLLSFFLMSFLTFFVVDATRLCRRFIELIAEPGNIWPDTTKSYFADRFDIKTYLPEWIYIELVVKRVSTVAKLINYPFVVLFIVIVSRLSYFDNWNMPRGLAIVYILVAAHAIYCALTLRRVAETVRKTALDSLDEKLIRVYGEKDQTRQDQDAKQIEHIINKIQSIREGPFSPFSQQPVFRTILVPFGGTVGLLILDYVTRLGQ